MVLFATAVALLLGSLSPVSIGAQQPAGQQPGVTLTGQVTGPDGTPLGSAQVLVLPLNLGTSTRPDGTYQLIIPAARVPATPVTVTARLLGYKPATTQLTLAPGRMVHDFTLPENPLHLGEIVVTGAGTVTEAEKLGTGRSSVDSTALVRSNESNVVNALAAKAPNVQVTSSAGDPGASSYIQVRGVTTITASDGQPLIVVDGVPVDNSLNFNNPSNLAANASAAPPDRAIDINPDDIANVEILKGAASGAIYGSRAGQGVILITTKHGQAGPTRYSLRSSVSMDQHGRLPDFQHKYGLGSGGAAPACVEGGAPNCIVPFTQAGSWGPVIPAGTPIFDHSAEMFQDGYTTDNNLTISGGDEKTTFYLSGGYNYDRGIVVGPNNHYRRIAVRFNGTHRILDNLKVGANVSYTDGDGGFLVSRNSTEGLLLGAWRAPANFNDQPFLDPTFHLQRAFRFPNPAPGSEQESRIYDNPFFSANENLATSGVGRTFGNVTAEYSPLSWLTFNETLGLDYANDERTQGWPWSTSTTTVPGASGVGAVNAGYIRTSQIDHNLTATAKYKASSVLSGTVTLGQNINSNGWESRQTLGVGLIAPQPFTLSNTANQLAPYDYRQTVHLESYFGQVTADLWNQLFLTAAVRNDGASTFGITQRRNWFPKGSAAWTFYRGAEGENRWLTFGKLRAAYGQSGTQPQPYLLASVFNPTTLEDGGFGPASSTQIGGVGGLVTRYNLPTQSLGPERVKEFETGVDLGLFRDKADFGITYYRQNSSGVILNIPVAGSTGYTEEPANAAALRNIGVELALNMRPVTTRDFSWEVGAQWAHNRSLVTDLAGRVVRAVSAQRRDQRPGVAGCGDSGPAHWGPVRHRLRALRPGVDHQQRGHRPHRRSVPGCSRRRALHRRDRLSPAGRLQQLRRRQSQPGLDRLAAHRVQVQGDLGDRAAGHQAWRPELQRDPRGDGSLRYLAGVAGLPRRRELRLRPDLSQGAGCRTGSGDGGAAERELVHRGRRRLQRPGVARHRGRRVREAPGDLGGLHLRGRLGELDLRVQQHGSEGRGPESAHLDQVHRGRSGDVTARVGDAGAGDRLLQ